MLVGTITMNAEACVKVTIAAIAHDNDEAFLVMLGSEEPRVWNKYVLVFSLFLSTVMSSVG
jgi:hypothetical protein